MSRQTKSRSSVPAFALYGEPLRQPDGQMIHVERIAVRSAVRAWTIRPHRHRDLLQILLISDGHVQVGLDGAVAAADSPCVVFVAPDTVHEFRFRPGTEGFVVTFSQGMALEELRIAPALQRQLASQTAMLRPAAADLPALGESLLTEFEGAESGRAENLAGLLGVLLTRVLRLAQRPPVGNGRSRSVDRDLLRRFRELVERHHRAHLPVSRYAALLGVSDDRLRRQCLALAGQPPGELVHLRQLREAQRQLHYTHRPVAQIACDLGFDDPAYFSRFFTQRVGVSPRRYRQQSGDAPAAPTSV